MLKRSPLDRPLYRAIWLAIYGPVRLLFRMRIRGLEHIPAVGQVVFASNHISNLDPIFVSAAATRQIHFMAKSSLWTFAPLGKLMEALGAFPVRRGEADRDAIRSAIAHLDGGAGVGIFAEGHRQLEGRLGDPQPGFALLALRKDVLTIPVALTGTDRIGRHLLPRLSKVTVTFGPPLDTGVDGATKAERHDELGRRLKQAWSELLTGGPGQAAGAR